MKPKSLIVNRNVVLSIATGALLLVKPLTENSRGSAMNEDLQRLRELNAQFITNYVNQDTSSHDLIIHRDFVCIQNSGEIMDREEYMKDWAQSYGRGRFTSFGYTDEHIRIFGLMALVRSKSVWTKEVDGKRVSGASIYTDTYIKENGKWLCVQAQITPIR